ncbi:MAG: hypothetical protein ABSG50_00480 [Opitutaceae bacterium]|jgi:hypothetical protein
MSFAQIAAFCPANPKPVVASLENLSALYAMTARGAAHHKPVCRDSVLSKGSTQE